MLYLDEAIIERKSVRNFKRVAVPDEQILKILDAGRLAPSAKNRQPWRFNVLSTEQKDRIANLLEAFQSNTHGTERATAKIIYSALNVIAITTIGTTVSDYISLGACLENMSLKAVDLGLGSLIICDTQSVEDKLVELFGSEKLAALFIVGYSDDSSMHANKKVLAEIVRGIEVAEADNIASDNLPEADVSADPFVFISYSHRDSNIVVSDIAELKRFGVRLWYDRSICSGEIWDEKALAVIAKPNCAGVFVYVSENAVQSESIAKELAFASNRFADKSCIVSVHIGDKPISGYDIPMELKSAFSVIPDEKKYIPRSTTLRAFNLLPIVAEAERLGAVAANGVYDDFLYEPCNGGVCITGYNGCSQKVEIPSSVAGLPVIAIGNSALRGNNSVREVTVPFTVKRIEDGAFLGMSELTSISLPKFMNHIGVAAFRGCTKLKTVELPTGIRILSEALFRDCTALIECVVPKTVEEFGEAVFRNCSSLYRVNMPTVRLMTEGGFYGCTSLRDLTISNNIEGLESQSFETCPHVNVIAGGFTYINGKSTKA